MTLTLRFANKKSLSTRDQKDHNAAAHEVRRHAQDPAMATLKKVMGPGACDKKGNLKLGPDLRGNTVWSRVVG